MCIRDSQEELATPRSILRFHALGGVSVLVSIEVRGRLAHQCYASYLAKRRGRPQLDRRVGCAAS
eukprot:11219473-Alexandrium_andersonii.AAC.1